MTGLAGDIELVPGGVVTILRGVEVLGEPRRVALGAHEVPGLVGSRPVQEVVVGQRIFGVEMEPALPTLLRGPGIPRDAEGLQASARKADQKL